MPEHYGVACKRVDCRERKSDFNSRKRAVSAFRMFLSRLQSPFLVVSFNNEGYISRAAMEQMLASRGEVHVLEYDYKRYVGAQIGIHDLNGNRVGQVSHVRNREYLYVVVPRGYPWSSRRVAAYVAPSVQRGLFGPPHGPVKEQ